MLDTAINECHMAWKEQLPRTCWLSMNTLIVANRKGRCTPVVMAEKREGSRDDTRATKSFIAPSAPRTIIYSGDRLRSQKESMILIYYQLSTIRAWQAFPRVGRSEDFTTRPRHDIKNNTTLKRLETPLEKGLANKAPAVTKLFIFYYLDSFKEKKTPLTGCSFLETQALIDYFVTTSRERLTLTGLTGRLNSRLLTTGSILPPPAFLCAKLRSWSRLLRLRYIAGFQCKIYRSYYILTAFKDPD